MYNCKLHSCQMNSRMISTVWATVMLAGSLQVTVHSRYDDWQLNSDTVTPDMELTFPSSYVRSGCNNSMLAELRTMLYPSSALEMDLNTAFRKYTSLMYRKNRYTSDQFVYVRSPSCMEPRPVLLHYFLSHAVHVTLLWQWRRMSTCKSWTISLYSWSFVTQFTVK